MNQVKKPLTKILIANRPFFCLGVKNTEVCHKDNKTYFKYIEDFVAGENFDIHLSAHLYMYQRFSIKIFQTEYFVNQSCWDKKENKMMNVIVGSGGFYEDYDDFVGDRLKWLDIVYLNKIFGYLNLELKTNESIEGHFYDIQHKIGKIKRDNFQIQTGLKNSLEIFKEEITQAIL